MRMFSLPSRFHAIIAVAFLAAPCVSSAQDQTRGSQPVSLREAFFPRKKAAATPAAPVSADLPEPEVAAPPVRSEKVSRPTARQASAKSPKPASAAARKTATKTALAPSAKPAKPAKTAKTAPSPSRGRTASRAEDQETAWKAEATGGAITAWPTGRKLVALTFDDGPNARVTPALLELLVREKVKATFYLLGQSVQACPQLVDRIAREGHELGNHSYSHPQLTKAGAEGTRRELTRARDLVASCTTAQMATMRPPYGAHNAAVRQVCAEMGYKVILWDVDTNDWRKGMTAQRVIDTIRRDTRDGSIILMHDRLPQITVPATEAAIKDLKAKGFEFVTVSELLAQPRLNATKKVAQGAGTGESVVTSGTSANLVTKAPSR